METKAIWEHANTHRELIRTLYHAICENRNINRIMDRLKQQIPCLIGIDANQRTLVFKSVDNGMVALHVREERGTLVLALETDIQLDYSRWH